MKYLILFIIFSVSGMNAFGQLKYTITYKDSSSSVLNVSIEPSSPVQTPVSFIMPRSIPGTYAFNSYDRFVKNVYVTIAGEPRKILLGKDEDAPRWELTDKGKQVSRIEYEVDLDKMERTFAPADACFRRSGFVGLLNYAVLGWIEGTEKQPVQCVVNTFSQWPVFSTNQPAAVMEKEKLVFTAENYFVLADGQLFMGPRFHVKEFKGLTPLFIASYCETENEWLDDYGLQGIKSMEILKDYFGELPFQHYSIMLIKALPLTPGVYPPFGMEHLNSSTFFGDTTRVRKAPMTTEEVKNTMPTFLHHMGHSLIPLHCYGDAYRPYVQEIPPIINNIWFNEGFMWFLPSQALGLSRMKTGMYNSVYKAPPAIKKLSLQELSQAASVMYSGDFRLGRGIYSRGALMAFEMDDYLKAKTNQQKSMKDVFRYLYQWSKKNKRPFTLEEFPALISQACDIDLVPIYKKWQAPIE